MEHSSLVGFCLVEPETAGKLDYLHRIAQNSGYSLPPGDTAGSSTDETFSSLDGITAEDRSFTATREEGARFWHIWKLTLKQLRPKLSHESKSGPHSSRQNQRKSCMKRLENRFARSTTASRLVKGDITHIQEILRSSTSRRTPKLDRNITQLDKSSSSLWWSWQSRSWDRLSVCLSIHFREVYTLVCIPGYQLPVQYQFT